MQLQDGTLEQPSAVWRFLSTATTLNIAALCRAFLYSLNTTEVNGLERFLKLLESRQDDTSRTRGLITVSNHISVMDDPLMWGVIPLRSHWGFRPCNRRWALGSHDICFKNRFMSAFFTYGQVLPAHRLFHSPRGGLFQPSITQAIRLLSKGPFPAEPHSAPMEKQRWSISNTCVDPFSEVPTAFTTTGEDAYLAPSAYACNSYSWIHVFPEGMIHQSTHKTMRYFKWGVSRLILEPAECPDIVPMWIEGTDGIMHEDRGFPRFIPRVKQRVSVTFGEKVDTDAIFGELRSKWQKLKRESEREDTEPLTVGILNEKLMYSDEARELRVECTRRVRDLVLEVRRSRGLSDEDPKASMAETWLREGPKREGRMDDGSLVRDI
ncbi:Lyso-phosphatidylcholine acyltransferase [Microsporum audouinii]